MAGSVFFDIAVGGKGSHGACPEMSVDPVLTVCHIATALQSIVSCDLSPRDPAVVSVTKVVGSDAYNVIPQSATISGTARLCTRDVGEQIEAAMCRISNGVAARFWRGGEPELAPDLCSYYQRSGTCCSGAACHCGPGRQSTACDQ